MVAPVRSRATMTGICSADRPPLAGLAAAFTRGSRQTAAHAGREVSLHQRKLPPNPTQLGRVQAADAIKPSHERR